MQNSIIVYRNPLEQQIWEGLMNGGFSVVFLVMFVFLFSFLTLNFFASYFIRGFAYKKNSHTVLLAITTVITVASVYFLG